MILGHWYLSGPMSHLPQFNFPAFRAAANDLRNRGIRITSPHETDTAETQAAAMASTTGAPTDVPETWGQILARDVQFIADTKDLRGIIFLPGWEKSRGARLEAFVGLLCGREFATYTPDGTLTLRSAEWVEQRLAESWGFGATAVRS